MKAEKAIKVTQDMEKAALGLIKRELVVGITAASAAGYVYQSPISPPQALLDAALIHEYSGWSMIEGKMRPIPERSFLRLPFRAHKKQIAKSLSTTVKEVLEGNKTPDEGLAAIGVMGRDVSLSAWDGNGSMWRALHPRTIKRKGHDTKLVDTGTLKASISYEVRDAAT